MLIFSFEVKNYNSEQCIKHEEPSKSQGTMGFIAARNNALAKFRETFPQNKDSDNLLKIHGNMFRRES